MGIIDRLLLKEIVKTLFVILAVLLFIFLANILVKMLREVAGGAIGQDVVAMLIGLQLIKTLGLLVPPAFFFTVLWVLGRMYRDSEMTALSAAGVSLNRIYRSVFIAAVPVALVGALWGLHLIPWAKNQIDAIKFAQQDTAAIANFKVGEFQEFKRGEVVIYTENRGAETGYLEGVFIQSRQQGKLGIITAKHAYQVTDQSSGDSFIILADGQRYTGEPGSAEYSVAKFSEYGIFLIDRENQPKSNETLATKPWRALLGTGDLAHQAEFQARWMMAWAVLAFALVAVPLARSRPRQGIYGRMSAAILIYFIFMNLQRVAENWMLTGKTPFWLGLWWVPALMMLLALLIIFLDSHWLYVNTRRVFKRA